MKEKPKIYWIGGLLNKQEREKEWVPLGADLKKQFESVVGDDTAYEFVWLSQCSKKKFYEVWSDPNTYGIVWYSHGAAVRSGSGFDLLGYPMTFDNKKLNPFEKIPKPGRNLQIVAFKSCASAKLHNEWQRVAPDVRFVTHRGNLFSFEWKTKYGELKWRFDQMKAWINAGYFDVSKPTPEQGAKYLLQLLPERFKQTSDEPVIYPRGGVGPSDAGVSMTQFHEEQTLFGALGEWLERDKAGFTPETKSISKTTAADDIFDLLVDLNDWLEQQALPTEKQMLSAEQMDMQRRLDKLLDQNLGFLSENERQDQDWLKMTADKHLASSHEQQQEKEFSQTDDDALLSGLRNWLRDDTERRLADTSDQLEERYAWIESQLKQQKEQMERLLQARAQAHAETRLEKDEHWIEQQEENQSAWLTRQLEVLSTIRGEQNNWFENHRQQEQTWLQNRFQDGEPSAKYDLHAELTDMQQRWQQEWSQYQQQWQQDWQQNQYAGQGWQQDFGIG